MDASGVPLGERALRTILDHVVAVGDAAETSYLEAKVEIDLAKPAGFTKVAKFLLGASNRMPQAAVRHFQGYAVLVLGAGLGASPGLPRGTEVHELEDRLRPYLGTGFPGFEFGRVAVGGEREVLFVIGSPPEQGQQPFPCRKSFQGAKQSENLYGGAIYVRGQSNTRPANAAEIDALVRRARSVELRPEVELEVEVLGPVHRVEQLDELLDALYDHTEKKFREASDKPVAARSPGFQLGGVFGAPRHLSAPERRDRLQQWLDARGEHVARGRPHLLGVSLDGMQLAVTSHGRFLSGPRLIVVFHGCEAIEYLEADDFDHDVVVEPVLGPQRDPYTLLHAVPSIPLARTGTYPVKFETAGQGVAVTLTPDSLHPDAPWITDNDDYCVLAPADRRAVQVTWTLTEQGNDKVYTGELEVSLAPPHNALELYRGLIHGAQGN